MGTQRALPAALLLLFPPHHARWPLFTAHHLSWGLHNMRPVNGPGGFGIGRCLHTMVKKGETTGDSIYLARTLLPSCATAQISQLAARSVISKRVRDTTNELS